MLGSTFYKGPEDKLIWFTMSPDKPADRVISIWVPRFLRKLLRTERFIVNVKFRAP